MVDAPRPSTGQMSADETRIRNLISASVEERGRMEKLVDTVTLKIEELGAKRRALEDVE